MIEYEPENNPYHTLVADITHKCNMKCANCYIPNRTIPDMDENLLYNFLQRLKKRTQIRIIGAEPTMRKDLPKIITEIKKNGHRPVLLTNGLKLSSKEYVKTLKESGLMHVYISMNGVDNDEWYKIIDNMKCAEKKIEALVNVSNFKMIPNIGCIMQNGVNMEAPKKIIEMLEKYKIKDCVIRLKNVGQIGRYSLEPEENLSLTNIMKLIEKQLNISYEYQNNSNVIEGYVEKNSRLFPLDKNSRYGKGIWFKLTDWNMANKEMDNQRRGRITQNWKISPFFEHVKENEFGY